MVMPLLGPFTTRELYGKVIDTFTDPVSAVFVYQYDGTRLEYGTATAVQSRVKNDQILDDIEDTSIDSYSKTRSLYIQLLAGRNPICEQEEEVINYD